MRRDKQACPNQFMTFSIYKKDIKSGRMDTTGKKKATLLGVAFLNEIVLIIHFLQKL
jgi:hypothetical protein